MRNSLFFIICVLISSHSFANNIATADSLYAARKYTESFDIYADILENQKQVSTAMLLKMAYIKEGLGNNKEALYYLNLYYLHTADKKVLDKLQSLADKSSVKGYEFSDFEYLQTIFYKFFPQVNYSLLALSILMLSLVYYLKIIKKASPAFPAVVMVLTLAALFYCLNFGRAYNKAIVNDRQTYLMSGPSAAAEVLDIIDVGSRLATRGREDVWTEVEYDNKTGYIKSDKLKQINY